MKVSISWITLGPISGRKSVEKEGLQQLPERSCIRETFKWLFVNQVDIQVSRRFSIQGRPAVLATRTLAKVATVLQAGGKRTHSAKTSKIQRRRILYKPAP